MVSPQLLQVPRNNLSNNRGPMKHPISESKQPPHSKDIRLKNAYAQISHHKFNAQKSPYRIPEDHPKAEKNPQELCSKSLYHSIPLVYRDSPFLDHCHPQYMKGSLIHSSLIINQQRLLKCFSHFPNKANIMIVSDLPKNNRQPQWSSRRCGFPRIPPPRHCPTMHPAAAGCDSGNLSSR